MGCCVSSSEELGNRLLEDPPSMSGQADIIALQCVPVRTMGFIESSGRVRQNDYNKTVLGWVDADGVAFRNDYNRTKVGRVDLTTGITYSADYNKAPVGRVNSSGQLFFDVTVVHSSSSDVPVGEIRGPSDTYKHAACAFFTLF